MDGTVPHHASRLEEGVDFFCGPETQQRVVYTVNGLNIQQCERCGLVLVNPRLKPHVLFDEVYVEGYGKQVKPGLYQTLRRVKRWVISPVRGRDGGDRQALFLARTLRRVYGNVPERLRVLEIGSFRGWFVEAAQRRHPGWELVGVEPSEAAARVAQEKGLDVRHGVLEDVEFDAASFDVVHMWQVLEHVYDPLHTLGLIRRCLRPGGLLTLRTPNFDSCERRRKRERWKNWAPEQHIYQYTYATLDRLLKEAGLERAWPKTIPFWMHWPSSLLVAARKPDDNGVAENGA